MIRSFKRSCFLKSAVIILWSCLQVQAQVGASRYFPDIEGYKTLVCDLHMHTVFSDGTVWPTVRVDEAWREGLDCIALSDHIEYQPHRDDLPTNHNRPMVLCEQRARAMNVLLIKGAEITRDTPPGHYNAIFLEDIDPLDTKKFLDCVQAANQQDAFLFWNHHAWKGEERGLWRDTQTHMFEQGWLHGMEVANGGSYYPSAHKWCMERGITMLGNSDIHQPSIKPIYSAHEHRTLTLVFAKERSVAAIKKALQVGRTAVWYQNQLIGKHELLESLFRNCVTVCPPHYVDKRGVGFVIKNNALVDMELQYTIGKTTRDLTVPARSKVLAKLPVQEDKVTPIQILVKNFLVAPAQGLSLQWKIQNKMTIQ